MSDKLHELSSIRDQVHHDQFIYDRVRVAIDNFILCRSTCELLTLANQKVNSNLHFLVAQKINLTVSACRYCESKAVVPLFLAEKLAIFGIDWADYASAQIMTFFLFPSSRVVRCPSRAYLWGWRCLSWLIWTEDQFVLSHNLHHLLIEAIVGAVQKYFNWANNRVSSLYLLEDGLCLVCSFLFIASFLLLAQLVNILILNH